jgi:hypothetical protein
MEIAQHRCPQRQASRPGGQGTTARAPACRGWERSRPSSASRPGPP